MRIGGAVASPASSTFQPTSARTALRAAARQVACAIWQPVTSANDACAGIPSSCFSQSPTTSSTTEADGPHAYSPAFWSQVEANQSAASAAGTAPPMTNPKYRPLGIPTTPSSPAAASSSITDRGSVGFWGSGRARATLNSPTLPPAGTGRVSSESMKSAAISAVRARSRRSSVTLRAAARSARDRRTVPRPPSKTGCPRAGPSRPAARPLP